MIALLFSLVALAQDDDGPAVCTSFDVTEWHRAMDGADAAVAKANGYAARRILDQTKADLPCLGTMVDPGDLARFARQEAVVSFFEQDSDAAVQWGLLARYAQPGFPWPSTVSPADPFRKLVDGAADPPFGGPADKGVAWPKGGAVLLDGALFVDAKARANVPGLVQSFDKKQAWVAGWWVDGSAFPDAVLGPPGKPPSPPKWYVAPNAASVATTEPSPSTSTTTSTAPTTSTSASTTTSTVPTTSTSTSTTTPTAPTTSTSTSTTTPTAPTTATTSTGKPSTSTSTTPTSPSTSTSTATTSTGKPSTSTSKPSDKTGYWDTVPTLSFDEVQGTVDCPWAQKRQLTASATASKVTVDSVDYWVHGAAAEQKFRDVLNACSEPAAVRRFDHWRSAVHHLSFKAHVYRDNLVRAIIFNRPAAHKKRGRPPG